MATQKKLLILLQPVNIWIRTASTMQLVNINNTDGGVLLWPRLRLYSSSGNIRPILFLRNLQILLQNPEPNFFYLQVYNQPVCGRRALVAVAGSFVAAGVPAPALCLLRY
jgi:hypothetical protein